MAASAWVVHDKAKLYAGDGVIDYGADTFKAILCLAASNISTTSIDAYSTVDNEVATNFGYTQNDYAVTTPTWTEATGTVTFNCDDMVWTAAGGSIVARYAGIIDTAVSSPVVSPVVCHSQLDTGDVTATTGNTFTVAIHASGVFTKT
jgi:hypothetical protein